jgi:hypothetical protein
MAMHDDDALTGSVPDPDTEPTPAELAHARRFAELVDKTLAGRTPPAMSTDDRALLEVATVIRATRGGLELAAERRTAVVEDALRQAIGDGPAAGRSVASISDSHSHSQSQARTRVRRWAPWVVAGGSALVAAAAVVALWLRPGDGAVSTSSPTGRADVPAGVPAGVPIEWRSRSADALIGPIAAERAGDASARVDAIFADRLDGFRARQLARRGRP